MELMPKFYSHAAPSRIVGEPVEMRPLILVVEDEAIIRMMVVETLADGGFIASESGNAENAMLNVETLGEELRAVILDVGLPDASGEKLFDRIRAVRPNMPIIVTTGYDTNELRRKLQDDPLAQILTKPYQPEMLNTILKEWGIGEALP